MRELTVHVEGQGYRGGWDTWHDEHHGRMVQVSYKGWMVQGPVRDGDPERIALFLLQWCVERALHGMHPGRSL
ncbi:MAG: hypothetical protein V2I63_07795 [Pseudomonadales bacterium]|jgi:hypothetical protein|nr:hypothetical protein [Pseudomonadales bacterium]